MNKTDVIKNTQNAFELIEKLYLETTFLIKEIEGLLSREPEEFIIGRPGGYQVTYVGSKGIEQKYVQNWMARKMSLFFVPKLMTESRATWQTVTLFQKEKKVIYLRILLNGKEIEEPKIWSGVLYGFEDKVKKKELKLEEKLISFETYDKTYFSDFPNINYEDASIKFKIKLISNNLFDINTSQEIAEKIITPTLKIFRETK